MEHRRNVSSCLGLSRSQSLGCRDSQNFSFTSQLHGETSHSKDHVETGEPALKATHIEKIKGRQWKFFSMTKTFPYTLLGALYS